MTVEIPSTFDRVSNIGAPVKLYQSSTATRIKLALSFAAMLGVSSIAEVSVLLYGETLREIGYGLYMYIAPLIPLAIAGVAFLRKVTTWNKAILVYDRGLAVKDRRGVQVWRWEDIQSIYAQLTRHLYLGIRVHSHFVTFS